MADEGFPEQSPLFHAEHADRYQRQDLIRRYEQRYNCRLVALLDAIFPDSIPLLEELLFDASADEAPSPPGQATIEATA